MANVNNPRGLEPVQPLLGMHRYPKSTAAAIYPNDAVILLTSGKVGVATAGSIELLGAAMQYATATDEFILVADDPDQQYYIKDDGVGGTLARTDVAKNADLEVTGTGGATYLKSSHRLDTSGVTIAAAQLRILDFHPDDEVGKYVRCRVVINEHAHAKKTAGI